jgi:hypothetical protein
MGRAQYRAAYLRYFLPWNIFKLCALFSSPEIKLPPHIDILTDLGSGLLTVPLALWLSFPHLRSAPLTVYCVDRNAKALEDGQRLFTAFAKECGEVCWQIKLVKADAMHPGIRGKAGLVTAFNVYNEISAGIARGDEDGLRFFARKTAAVLSSLVREDGVLIAGEPGIPSAGQFLSSLRGAFLEQGYRILQPCPHEKGCPMPGGKKGAKWCHFVLDTDSAPQSLHSLSEKAHLPKRKTTLSFLMAAPKNAAPSVGKNALRILSAPIRFGGDRAGVYACGAKGLALLYGRDALKLPFGSLIVCPMPATPEFDRKTGALLVPLPRKNRPIT